MVETHADALIPDPADIVAILGGIALTPWPTTATERVEAYAPFGLSEGVELEPDDSGLELSTMLAPGIQFITASSFGGEFVGIALHLYGNSGSLFADTIRGYEELAKLLERRFGRPEVVGGDENFPALGWSLGPLSLELYAFTVRDSGVMVGIEHTARSAAYEAAAYPAPDPVD